jgi:hypothetical protein
MVVSRFALLPLVGALTALAAPAALAGGDPTCLTCYRHVVQPPVYGTVAEQVMVQAPRTYAETIPGDYQTVSETVMVAPARKVWQVTRDAYGNLVGCWVETPARYAVQHRQVMIRPPSVVRHTSPAVYATQHRQVLVQPARSGWEPVGAAASGGYAGIVNAGFGVGVRAGGGLGVSVNAGYDY